MRNIYAKLETKAIDDEERIIQGIATHIAPDRMNDVVEPGGAKYALPLPLLSQHDHRLPIGHVVEARTLSDRIEIVAKIAKDTGLEYIETAWKQLKAGLVRGLSIGFRPLEYEKIKDSYGQRFKEWEWLELSAVVIPAQALATIANIKSYGTDPNRMREASMIVPANEDPRVIAARASLRTAREILSISK